MKRPFEPPCIMKLQSRMMNKHGLRPGVGRRVRKSIEGVKIAELVERWQRDGLVATDRRPAVVAQLFLSMASGLCTSGALRAEIFDDRALRSVVDGQIAALVGADRGGRP